MEQAGGDRQLREPLLCALITARIFLSSQFPCARFMSTPNDIETALRALEAGGAPSEEAVQALQTQANRAELPTFYREKFGARLQRLRERAAPRAVLPPRPRRTAPRARAPAPRAAPSEPEPSEPAAEAPRRKETLELREPRPSLALANLVDSTVLASDVAASAYLDNVRDSRVYVACQQCRLRNCHGVDVYLERCARPVIEQSSRIRFFVPAAVDVADFQWPGPHSPNYSVHVVPWTPLAALDLGEAASGPINTALNTAQ